MGQAQRAGGLAFIGGSLAFLVVVTLLSVRFNYPDVLDGRAADVLPALHGMGGIGRGVWAVYAVLPLLWIPAGLGTFYALQDRAEVTMRAGLILCIVSAVAMMLGLMRWPSVHWELAELWTVANTDQREIIAALFDGLNVYLGNFLGEFLGEVSIYTYITFVGLAMIRSDPFPSWIGYLGSLTGAVGLVAAFRNVTDALDAVADAAIVLLPVWMIVVGTALLRYRTGVGERP